MSVVQTRVRPNAYLDSLTLLRVSSTVSGLPGVEDAALVMGTPLNREVLRDSGLLADDGPAAGPNDLVLAVRALDAAAAEAALREAERLLDAGRTRQTDAAARAEEPPRSVRGAHRRAPEANLAVISVPGPFAAAEAHQALADGLHVFLFSDNVPLADEIALKQRASAAGLLVMGPDCGTAILNGVGLGFANLVRRGNVGLVGASGTGLQELSVLLHQAGLGVSHAIGTGSRDLHAEIGGLTTVQALRLLAEDPETATIVVVSKPPALEVAQRVLAAAAQTGKPVVACLLGVDVDPPQGVRLARTLADAAALAAGQTPSTPPHGVAPASAGASVVGLFCGGTLAQEAELILDGVPHTVVDFGDDRFTQGRLHPMLDPTLRNHAILDAAARPEVGVLLLDVVLGHGAHPDPAAVVAPVIRQAVARPGLRVLVHLLGTDLDPQGLAHQADALRQSGAELFPSNAAAAESARTHASTSASAARSGLSAAVRHAD